MSADAVEEEKRSKFRTHGVATMELDTAAKEKLNDPSTWFDQSWPSHPAPPKFLLGDWDVDDLGLLDRVKCEASIRIIHIDPKNGEFQARMICQWELRTLNSKDRTWQRIRVPGIRVPGMMSEVEESRIWRNDEHTSDSSIYWEGTTVMALSGYEIFPVSDFPFDRQVLDMDMFDFVWRSQGDSESFDEAMKVVSLTISTHSMLPEWQPYTAKIVPLAVRQPAKRVSIPGGLNPESCSRFAVKLRFQRHHQYYITQVFLVTYSITCVSLFPLALPLDGEIGNRFAIMSGGLLTLTAFKYTIADQLPSVPYLMFIDKWLVSQILWVCAGMLETLALYKYLYRLDPVAYYGEVHAETKELVAGIDIALLLLSIIFWSCWLGYIIFFQAAEAARVPWQKVMTCRARLYNEKEDHEKSCEIGDGGSIFKSATVRDDGPSRSSSKNSQA